MKTAFLSAAFAVMFLAGCSSTTVNNNDGDEDEVNDGDAHDENSGDAWDGEHWVVVVHGHRHHPGCGHYFHHGVWNVHVETYVFPRGHGHHFVVRVVHRRHR